MKLHKNRTMNTNINSMEDSVKKAASIFIAQGAKEVFLFGSALTKLFTANSDIDFAVSGLPSQSFYKTIGMARREIRRPIDVVDLDEKNSFTDYLRKSGELKRVA